MSSESRSNWVDAPRTVALFTVPLIFTLTSIISVVLRLWAKRINRAKLVIEDHLCIIGLVFVIGQFICIVLQIDLGGMGQQAAGLPPTHIVPILQILVAFQSLYALAVGAVKCSICYFYIRVFAVNRRFRIMVYLVVAFIVAWVIMSVIVAFVACIPFEYTWNPTIPGGHCHNQIAAWVAEAVLDLVADIMVFALPLKAIWTLQINNKKKGVLFVVFGLGVSTMIMAILRIVGLAQIDQRNFQYTGTPPLIYSILEPAIGITVACIPLMQPVFKNTWLGRQLGQSSNRSYPSGEGHHEGHAMKRPFKSNSVSVSAKYGPDSSIDDHNYDRMDDVYQGDSGRHIMVRREFMTDRV